MGYHVCGFCCFIRHLLLVKGVSMLLNFKSHHITTLLTNSSKSSYFTRVKAKFTIFSEACNALHTLVSHYLPPSPRSYFSSHTGLLVILRTCYSHIYLRAFALATPSTEILFPQLLHDSHLHLFQVIVQMLPVNKDWHPWCS